MVDLNVLSQILSVRNGVWTIAVLAALALFRGWAGLPAFMAQLVARRRAIADEKAADWVRLRDEVKRHADELREVRENERDCQRKLIDALRRIATLEGYQDGRGEYRQEAQMIVSTERQRDAEARKGKSDGSS